MVDLLNVERMRAEAFQASEAIRERHHSTEALERQVNTFARYIVDLIDRLALLNGVAHRAWHLMDDSGELAMTDDNGVADYMHSGIDHQRLSDALDALEAVGWDGCEPSRVGTSPDRPTQEGDG